MWLNLQFFDFTVVPKQYALSRNDTSDFELLAFPEPATCSTTLFCITGKEHLTIAPRDLPDHEDKQPRH